MILKALRKRPLNRRPPPFDAQIGIAVLNEQAPLKTLTDPEEGQETFICREAILGRDQRIAGYQFMLQEGALNRIRLKNQRVQNVYGEILLRSLVDAELGRILGHRLAFIDIPDFLLSHPYVLQLSPRHTVLVITPSPTSPAIDELTRRVRQLRAAGFQIGIPDPDVISELSPLLPLADYVVLRASVLDAQRGLALANQLSQQAPQARVLVRELSGVEDFRFAFQLGKKWSQKFGQVVKCRLCIT